MPKKRVSDVLKYVACNSDLMSAFGADRMAARNHYFKFGIRETWRPVTDDTVRIQVGGGRERHAAWR